MAPSSVGMLSSFVATAPRWWTAADPAQPRIAAPHLLDADTRVEGAPTPCGDGDERRDAAVELDTVVLRYRAARDPPAQRLRDRTDEPRHRTLEPLFSYAHRTGDSRRTRAVILNVILTYASS